MIVISHPWEFVPKGSSHLNYHTNSVNTKAGENKATAAAGATSRSSGGSNDAQSQQQQQQLNQQPFLTNANEKNRVLFNQRKNIKLMINSELNNSSLNEFSFVYWQKTPLINQMNFETSVFCQFCSFYFNNQKYKILLSKAEKWRLKQINEYCENEIFIKDNQVIVSYGGDNDSKIIKRSFTFDSPIFEVCFQDNSIEKYIFSNDIS